MLNSENRQPAASTRSASRTTSSVAARAPYPSEPQKSGESFGNAFLRSQVVTTGIASRPASLSRPALYPGPRTPPPTMITGRWADASRARAASTAAAGAAGGMGRALA